MSRNTTPMYILLAVESLVPLIKTMKEKRLGRVRRTESRLVRKEKVVGIEMNRQLIFDTFL